MNGKKLVTGVVLTLVFCMMVALGALLLAPSSPALKLETAGTLEELRQTEETYVTTWALWQVDTGLQDAWEEPVPLMMTGYGLFLAVGAVLAVAAMAALNCRRVRSLDGGAMATGAAAAALCGVFALLCGHWMYCALRWGYIINDLAGDWSFPLQFWQGGFTMYGAILGALLGAVVAAKAMKIRLSDMMDMLIPGLLIVVAAGRLGEMLTSQGVANTRAAEALRFLPFSGVNEWGDCLLKVWPYEAMAALAALVVSGVILLRRKPAGRAAEVGLAIVSAYQILFESMRGDELIRFGFVCLNMIAAAVVLAFMLVTRLIRCVRNGGWNAWQIVRCVLFAVGCGVVIVVEFALDGKIRMFGGNNTALYVLDVLAVTGMMLSVAICDGRKEAA